MAVKLKRDAFLMMSAAAISPGCSSSLMPGAARHAPLVVERAGSLVTLRRRSSSAALLTGDGVSRTINGKKVPNLTLATRKLKGVTSTGESGTSIAAHIDVGHGIYAYDGRNDVHVWFREPQDGLVALNVIVPGGLRTDPIRLPAAFAGIDFSQLSRIAALPPTASSYARQVSDETQGNEGDGNSGSGDCDPIVDASCDTGYYAPDPSGFESIDPYTYVQTPDQVVGWTIWPTPNPSLPPQQQQQCLDLLARAQLDLKLAGLMFGAALIASAFGVVGGIVGSIAFVAQMAQLDFDSGLAIRICNQGY